MTTHPRHAVGDTVRLRARHGTWLLTRINAAHGTVTVTRRSITIDVPMDQLRAVKVEAK